MAWTLMANTPLLPQQEEETDGLVASDVDRTANVSELRKMRNDVSPYDS
jgi:hypothetical protein